MSLIHDIFGGWWLLFGNPRPTIASGPEADYLALAGDWEVIGNDLRKVMAENPPESFRKETGRNT